MDTFTNRFTTLLDIEGVTSSDLQRVTGCTRQCAWNWLHGKTIPSAPVFVKICLAYDLNVHMFREVI